MSYGLVIDMARDALMLALMLAGPLLLIALAVGLLLSILQAVTQVQEQTLVFVVKLFSVGADFLLTLTWMLQTAVKYTIELVRSLPNLAG
jgi:flagellar biosynthetic protein FliQ